MSGQSLYVYGVMTAPAAGLQGCAGVGGEAVRLLPEGDLAALVSDTGTAPVQRTRRNMLAHTAVLEQAMPCEAVLPLRFGTVAPDATALRACIAANNAAFRAALRDIDGRVELGVKASWKPGHVYTHVVERDPALRQLRDRLRTRPQGETYYERIELGRRVEAALAQLRASEAAAIMAELQPIAEREAELKPHGDDMIFNRAFLVRRSAEAAFDAAVERIAERCADRMELRYVGPVPPFNFVTLQAGWLTAPAAAEGA